METHKILTKEQLGEMYYELRSKFHSYFSPWSNMMGPQGDPKKTKKELQQKMDSISQELGDEFLLTIKLKLEIRELDDALKDVQKNNDELEERIERLERCIIELRSNKKNDKTTLFGTYNQFPNCESPVPDKSGTDHRTYRSNIYIS